MLFTCENRRYRTDTSKGFRHGPNQAAGSVFPGPLAGTIAANEYTLWLEHVVEIKTNESVYWLMWYNPSGKPTIPLSGVLSRDDVRSMAQQLIEVP